MSTFLTRRARRRLNRLGRSVVLQRGIMGLAFVLNIYLLVTAERWWQHVPPAVSMTFLIVAQFWVERLRRRHARERAAYLLVVDPTFDALRADYMDGCTWREQAQIIEWMLSSRDPDDAPPVVRDYYALVDRYERRLDR